MAAGLGALGDHRVAPVISEPEGLGDSRRARQHSGTGRPHPIDQSAAGSPKWKLTTFGRSSSTTSQRAASKGSTPAPGPGASTPSSA